MVRLGGWGGELWLVTGVVSNPSISGVIPTVAGGIQTHIPTSRNVRTCILHVHVHLHLLLQHLHAKYICTFTVHYTGLLAG